MTAFQWGASGHFDLSGACLEYATWGPSPAAAATLVLLHEGLGSLRHWRDFPQALVAATGLGVLAYSRVGYGGSSRVTQLRPVDYLNREAEVLPLVLRDAGIVRAVLLGHSDGGSIAACYLSCTSDPRVLGGVLIAPHFFVEPQGVVAIMQAGDAFRTGGLRDGLARYHKDPDGAFWGWHDVWTSREFLNWTICDALPQISKPMLILQGDADPYGSLAQVEALQTALGDKLETRVLKGCGHAPHKEDRATTLRAITSFCKKIV